MPNAPEQPALKNPKNPFKEESGVHQILREEPAGKAEDLYEEMRAHSEKNNENILETLNKARRELELLRKAYYSGPDDSAYLAAKNTRGTRIDHLKSLLRPDGASDDQWGRFEAAAKEEIRTINADLQQMNREWERGKRTSFKAFKARLDALNAIIKEEEQRPEVKKTLERKQGL